MTEAMIEMPAEATEDIETLVAMTCRVETEKEILMTTAGMDEAAEVLTVEEAMAAVGVAGTGTHSQARAGEVRHQ